MQHVSDQLNRHAATDLLYLAAILERKTRPQSDGRAIAIDEYTIITARGGGQRSRFKIAFAKLHGARQRQGDRFNVADLRFARLDRTVAIEPDNPQRLATAKFPRRKLRGAHWRGPDELGVILDDGQVVQWVDVGDVRGDFQCTGKRHSDVAHRYGNGVAIDDHEAAFGIDEQPGSRVIAFRHA